MASIAGVKFHFRQCVTDRIAADTSDSSLYVCVRARVCCRPHHVARKYSRIRESLWLCSQTSWRNKRTAAGRSWLNVRECWSRLPQRMPTHDRVPVIPPDRFGYYIKTCGIRAPWIHFSRTFRANRKWFFFGRQQISRVSAFYGDIFDPKCIYVQFHVLALCWSRTMTFSPNVPGKFYSRKFFPLIWYTFNSMCCVNKLKLSENRHY